MQLAVLSDIHSNHHALQTCLDHATHSGADAFLFLGDYVGELAYPQKTMELLYRFMESHDCRFTRGNREDYWAEYEARGRTGWKECDTTTGCLYYAYHHLSEADLSFFRSLPQAAEITFPGLPPLSLCHGSPSRTNEHLLPGSENTWAALETCPNDYLLCGHTHVPRCTHHHRYTYMNPGSVSIPKENSPRGYMTLENDTFLWKDLSGKVYMSYDAV